jgi:predicted kinase
MGVRELIIFVGLQGAGKSTYYCAHFAQTHDHVVHVIACE